MVGVVPEGLQAVILIVPEVDPLDRDAAVHGDGGRSSNQRVQASLLPMAAGTSHGGGNRGLKVARPYPRHAKRITVPCQIAGEWASATSGTILRVWV